MRDISLNELIEYYHLFIDEKYAEEKYAEEDSTKRGKRINENHKYLRAFQGYLIESKFDFNGSIGQLIEGDPYKFENSTTKINKKHIKNIFSHDFIQWCRTESINTLPLLPYYFYRDNKKYAKFHFNENHHASFIRFRNAFKENSIPLNQLALILLNIFYRFSYETLKKLRIHDIQQDYVLSGMGPIDGHKTTIRKVLADKKYTHIPITEEVVAVLLKSSKLNEDGFLCKISQRWILYNFKHFLKKEFGFSCPLEFKRTVMYYLVGTIGFDMANAYLGLGSRSHTKNTYSSETNSGGIAWLKEFYPLHPFYDQKFMFAEYDTPEIMREFHEQSEGVTVIKDGKKITVKPTLEQIMNPLGSIQNKSD